MRCSWAENGKQNMIDFHDHEWGKPQHDEQRLFEILSLMTFQAGLQWQLILDRRSVLKQVFNDFDIPSVAAMTEREVEKMIQVERMIANRRKIRAVIQNAQTLNRLHKKKILLEQILWSLTSNQVIDHRWQCAEQIPSQSALSVQFARQLKYYGFTFVGPKNVYAYLETIGVINDHLIGCEWR
ncbi:DNA-3-methyladenine glycosylase I [Ligilactobacillus araffinosus]|uniref:DNA-3-methyladenine glycosylase 1 n=1 Tax=Ligilactobacillus araffinosus DSM 20653 TaxID=1423820 RepID=A0A0R1ZBU3_9LACO|nr:DNA-3-methyladenine glycosylase I [Ligilactobacillus araffinosus]KRM51778.1 DNA-3-methyladenine glycosylase 1 [Ligilactobacillus araffinosus DSM 20653]